MARDLRTSITYYLPSGLSFRYSGDPKTWFQWLRCTAGGGFAFWRIWARCAWFVLREGGNPFGKGTKDVVLTVIRRNIGREYEPIEKPKTMRWLRWIIDTFFTNKLTWAEVLMGLLLSRWIRHDLVWLLKFMDHHSL